MKRLRVYSFQLERWRDGVEGEVQEWEVTLMTEDGYHKTTVRVGHIGDAILQELSARVSEDLAKQEWRTFA